MALPDLPKNLPKVQMGLAVAAAVFLLAAFWFPIQEVKAMTSTLEVFLLDIHTLTGSFRMGESNAIVCESLKVDKEGICEKLETPGMGLKDLSETVCAMREAMPSHCFAYKSGYLLGFALFFVFLGTLAANGAACFLLHQYVVNTKAMSDRKQATMALAVPAGLLLMILFLYVPLVLYPLSEPKFGGFAAEPFKKVHWSSFPGFGTGYFLSILGMCLQAAACLTTSKFMLDDEVDKLGGGKEGSYGATGYGDGAYQGGGAYQAGGAYGYGAGGGAYGGAPAPQAAYGGYGGPAPAPAGGGGGTDFGI